MNAALSARAVLRAAVSLWLVVVLSLLSRQARAQEAKEPAREARFVWNSAKTQLFVDLSYRDVIDDDIKKKLTRGLPTTIVLTGTVFQVGTSDALSTTAQTCKITWHVWDEVYLVE